MHWQDKVVLVTGASSGIGRALAVSLAQKGAKLGLIARDPHRLEQTLSECETVGGQAFRFVCDVTDPSAVRASADYLRKAVGRIDILIANAGIGGNDEDTRNLLPSAVKQVIDINLLGAANSVNAVLP